MSRGEVAYAFPKPGPALKGVLGVVAIVGILQALVGKHTTAFAWLVCNSSAVLHGQVWRLLTAAVVSDPSSFTPLLFTLIGLYFLSTDLERRWGGGRFLRFLATSTVVGFALAVAVDLVAPASLESLHPAVMFGANAAISATAIAWSRLNADAQVRLMMVVPVSGRTLFWVTIGFCVIGVIYGGGTEGVVAPFGGVLTGVLLAGDPSPLRRAYLRLKLGLLRRGAAGSVPTAYDIASGKKRGNRPALRAVQGGQSDSDDDEPSRRTPPKDKRYLN